MEHHVPAYHGLASHLKQAGLLGTDDTPLAEIMLHTTRPFGLSLIPHEGADPAKVQQAKEIAEGWDWGKHRPPRVTIEGPWREGEVIE